MSKIVRHFLKILQQIRLTILGHYAFKERLEPCKKFSDPIKRLKLKAFENVHKKILLKTSDWSSINSRETYNPRHDTLELYDVQVQVWFATSKTKLDI